MDINEIKYIINEKCKICKTTLEQIVTSVEIPLDFIEKLEKNGIITNERYFLRLLRALELDPIDLFNKAKLDLKKIKLENDIIYSENKAIQKMYCGSWLSFLNYYFDNIFETLDKDFIWRGHKNSSWKLESTLLREYPEGIDENLINIISDRFKKSTLGNHERIEIDKLYSKEELNDNMLWLSLGQHFGLKTPLLDWTNTPYVASFFAYIDKFSETSYRALYALNRKKFEELMNQLDEDIKIIDIENHFNKRLINQQGLFMYGPLEADLESILEKIEEKQNIPVLYKFLVPNSDRKDILKNLNKMNINPKSLFPDLIGASISTNIEIELEL